MYVLQDYTYIESSTKKQLVREYFLSNDFVLTQLKRISNPSLGENPLSAHPSVLIRTKALNDFSITDIHKHYGNIDPRKFESWWI